MTISEPNKALSHIRQSVFDQDHVSIYYTPAKSLVETIWHSFANSEHYREAMAFCLELALRKKVRYWLSDRRQMRAIRPVDQEWTATVLAPQFMQSNLKKVAVITSTDIFNQMATNAIHIKANNIIKFDSRHFTDPAAAWAWIEQN